MNCPNCQAKNVDNAKFCGACGTPLESLAQTTTTTPAVTPIPVVAIPQPPIAKKKSKKGLITVLVALVLVVALGASVFVFGQEFLSGISLFDNRTPFERLVDAFEGTFESESGQVTMEMKINSFTFEDTYGDPSLEMVQNIISGISLNATTRYDENNKVFDGEMEVRLQGTSLMKGYFYMDESIVGLNMPLLYDQPMYMTWETMIERLQTDGDMLSSFSSEFGLGMDADDFGIDDDALADFDFSKFEMSPYMALMGRDKYKSYKDLDWSEYKERLLEYYEEFSKEPKKGDFTLEFDDEVSFKGYSLNYVLEADEQSELLQELMEDLVDIMLDDDNLVVFIEEMATKLLTTVIENEDFVMYAMLTENMDYALSDWDDDMEDELLDMIDDLEDNIIDALEELGESMLMDNEMSQVSDSADMETAVEMVFDNKNHLRRIAVDTNGRVDMDGTWVNLDMTLLTEFDKLNDEIEVAGIDKKNGVDIGTLSELEYMAMMEEMQMNVMTQLESNPLLSELFTMFMMNGF